MAYIYTYKFTYIVLAERGVLDDPPKPPLATALVLGQISSLIVFFTCSEPTLVHEPSYAILLLP